jgi:hypothetical protein
MSPANRRSLADLNECRDWRKWADLAAVLVWRTLNHYVCSTEPDRSRSTICNNAIALNRHHKFS